MRLSVWSSVAFLLTTVGCGPTGSTDARPGEQVDGASDDASTARQSRALDHDREHWMVAGAESRGEAVSGDDGEPTTISGRFVNAGEGIDHGSVGGDQWLVASDSGFLQLLEKDGTRTGEAREAFDGDGEIRFVVRGDENWVVGGTAGDLQRVDRFGQPTSDRVEPFGNDGLTAGAWGSSHWVIGSEGGELVHLDPNSFQTRSSILEFGAGDAEIAEILYTGSKWWALTGSDIAEVTSNQVLEPTTIADGRAVTAAATRDGTIVVGADDGGVLAASSASGLAGASWSDALDGPPVRDLVWNGSEWLAVGDGGRVRTLDSSGAPTGSVTTVANGHDIDAARPLSDGWMVGVEEASSVTTLDADLDDGLEHSEWLDGAAVRDVAAGPPGMLAVGDDGKFRMLDAGGTPTTEVATVDGVDRLQSAQWNGDNFLAGGTGGTVATIDEEGSLVTTIEVLDGTDVVEVSWNRSVWLIVGADGEVRRLQADGTKFKDRKMTGLDTVHAAKYNGSEWMLVGANGEKGAFVVLDDDTGIRAGPSEVSAIDGHLRALDWNGNEWLAGGDGGYVVRIDQAGSVIDGRAQPGVRAVLSGRTVRAISFNGNTYLVGGDYGITRRLEFDTLPIRTGVVVNNYRTVYAAEWAHARGFAGGPCISSDFCIRGTCRGTVTDGFCCESACDGSCESCFEDETGEPDGRCVPVPEGESPPERKASKGNGCVEASPETCGQTGACDGNGACALYDSETQCEPPECSNGEQTPAGHCDGAENCVVPDTSECEPYVCGGDACRRSCESDEHCFTGFECRDGECKPLGSNGDGENGDDNGDGGDDDDGGCSAAGGSAPVGSFGWLVAFLGGLLLMRRRE